jgi:rare lipoprotein A (peptidoglycan hydrolase)
VARARTNRAGVFVERFWPRRLGRLDLRVRASGIPARHVRLSATVATVYHQVIASWYGPGGVTACGEELGAATQGVANKTLPCGTLVTLRYRDRTVRVPVIDRGPFVPGRDYDLTYATRLALGAGDVSEIWASA